MQGVLSQQKKNGNYDEIDDAELLSFIIEECQMAECDYVHAFGGVYKASDFNNKDMFLYKATDGKGNPHSFALTVLQAPYTEGEIRLRALEVHKLTHAGKIAADNTDTDYKIEHFVVCGDGENSDHNVLVGIVELTEKIKKVIRGETLYESFSPVSNCVMINGRNYGIGPIGTITPTYVRTANTYSSRRVRKWDGSEYGFLVDGKLFTGEEMALMFNSHEGAHVKFYVDNPSSDPLGAYEFLMQIRISQTELVDELVELIYMFTTNGRFERKKDLENFGRLFERDILTKLKLYYESHPHGYGSHAGMEIIRKLNQVEGTEKEKEKIRKIIRE